MNLLYCLDKGYNIQTYISICSFLSNYDNDINIHIIHNEPASFDYFKNMLTKEFKNLKSISIYKFKNTFKLPNASNSHLTEATYYRLLIEDYLPNNLEIILYLDGDVLGLKNLTKDLNIEVDDFKKSKMIISAKNVNYNNSMGRDYFNAGVMLIDFRKWKLFNVKSKFLKIIKNKDNFKFWDQDILNEIFPEFKYLNPILNEESSNSPPDNTLLFHYSGKNKPWSIKGLIEQNSIIFYEFLLKSNYQPKFKIKKIDKYIFIIKNIKNIIRMKRFKFLKKYF